MNKYVSPENHKRSYRSQLSRQVIVRYILCLVAIPIGVVFLALLAWMLTRQVSWPLQNDFIYDLLFWCQSHITELILLCTFCGWIAVTFYFLNQPLRYLDELMAASERLAHPEDRPLVLPRAMKNMEDQLNLVREQALRSAMAAREAEQRKNDLIVYLAHDLKTPLTSVIGYLTLLQDEPQISSDLRARYTGIALDKAERLEDLINEFFDITRFNLSHLELEKCPTDLTRMLEQVANEFQPLFKEKNLRCELDLPKAMMYDCDPDKLARVFDNLLRNAFYYSFPDTAVTVAGRQTETGITLSFTNAGKTIPPEKLSRIFEQFFRLDSSRATHTGGAGLGLAIAKEIVELHGGAIHAESADNQITFLLHF